MARILEFFLSVSTAMLHLAYMYGPWYNRSQFQHKSLFMIVEARFYHGYLLRIVNSRLPSLILALS